MDNNFPAYAAGRPVHRLDGVGVIDAGAAVLSLLPLDTFVDEPIRRMQVVDKPDELTDTQSRFLRMAQATAGEAAMGSFERFEFYRQVREAFCVIATGETQPYSCFLLSKGVL